MLLSRPVWFFSTLLWLCNQVTLGVATAVNDKNHSQALDKVFETLEDLIRFFNEEHKELIVDTIFGIRVLEGTMNKLLESIQKGEINITQNLQKKIKNIHHQASSIANRSTTFAEALNPEYFETIGFTAEAAWNNIKPFRQLNIKLAIPINNEIPEPAEEELDKCFGGLIGSKKHRRKPCIVSRHCWKVNTTPGVKGYTLTHQLLYFLLGEVKGCTKVFHSWVKKSRMKGTINSFLAASCASMYLQMLEQEKLVKNKKTLDLIDLYLEQAVVCGMLGYEQFLSLERLDLILSWKLPRGCYGYNEGLGIKKDLEEEENGVPDRTSVTTKKTMRRLQLSKELEDGCELHSSGVVTGLLGLYVRWHIHHITRQSVKNWQESRSNMAKQSQIQTSRSANTLESWSATFIIGLTAVIVCCVVINKRLRHRIRLFF